MSGPPPQKNCEKRFDKPRFCVYLLIMTNAQITTLLLSSVRRETKNAILDNIARHYGIRRQDALEEITGDEAEFLLDYITGSFRTTVHLLMIKYHLV